MASGNDEIGLSDVYAALQKLLNAEETHPLNESKWYSDSFALMEMIDGAKVSSFLEEHIWHYLSDLDIRQKDAEYARVQIEGLKEILSENSLRIR